MSQLRDVDQHTHDRWHLRLPRQLNPNPPPSYPRCNGGGGGGGGRKFSTGHHVLCTTQIGPLGQEDLRLIRWGHTY